jgi:hypothetical protein
MWRMNRPTVLTILGAPLLLLVAGGALGRVTRSDDRGTASVTDHIGVPLPTGAALEAYAPARPLPSAPKHVVYDRSDIVGYQAPRTVIVPKGAALPLDSGSPAPIDLATMQPARVVGTAPTAPVDAVALASLKPTATPPSTLAPPTTPPAPTSSSPVRSQYIDPCVATSATCAGAGADVRNSPERSPKQVDPLQMTLPFDASQSLAALCNTIEHAGGVPDPFLPPATRPTIGVVVNQPSTIAVTGTWADGSALDKLTMVTSPTFDAQWQKALVTDHRQHGILACITLPLDAVRPHATAGRARLTAHLLAISATGRTELEGPVELAVPLDSEDLRFSDQMRFGDLGLQRTAGGLSPTLHVHYAFTSDTMVAAGHLDPRTTRIYDRHALVENADCAGWANNQQGIDRTADGSYTVTHEKRTISGRPRPVTVVDGELRLDTSMPPGWQGYLCTQLVAADNAGNHETLVLRGAEVRSPLAPVYSVGAVVDDPAFPADDHVAFTFTRVDGLQLCTTSVQAPNDPASGKKGAACTVAASTSPGGVVVGVHVLDAQRHELPALALTVPLNPTACNPDDPYGARLGACSTGYRQSFELPVTADGRTRVHAVLVVDRQARAGSMSTDPAHEWQIGAIGSFTF